MSGHGGPGRDDPLAEAPAEIRAVVDLFRVVVGTLIVLIAITIWFGKALRKIL